MALAFRSSSTGGNGSGTTLTVSAPAGMASGDLAIAVVNVLSDCGPISASGWTKVVQAPAVNGPSAAEFAVFKRAATGAHSADFTWDGDNAWRSGAILTYSGYSGQLVALHSVVQTDGWNENLTFPSVTSPSTGQLICAVGSSNAVGSSTPPAGMTERVEFAELYVADQAVNGGATGVKTMALAGAGNQTNVQVSLVVPTSGSPFGPVNTNPRSYLALAIALLGGTPDSGGVAYANTNPKAYIDAEITAAGGTPPGSGYVNTNPIAYINSSVSTISPTAPDTTAPQTTITSAPSGTVNINTATFAFSANEPATFETKMDSGSWTANGTSNTKSYTGLSDGSHTFQVRATDQAGNTDASPASASFDIDTTDPGIVPDPPVGPFTEIDGNYATEYGASWLGSGSRTFQKLYIHENNRDNIRAMHWSNGSAQPVPADNPIIVEDCKLYDASASPPLSLNGTAESNLWIGGRAEVRRVDLRRGAWMGLWTGGITTNPVAGCYQSLFEEMSITQQRVGIYCEHVTKECTFRNFVIEAEENGVYIEWWYGGIGSNDLLFEDFEIDITGGGWGPRDGYGFMLDAGTYGCTIRNGIIRGGKGIELPNHRAGPGTANTVTNVVDENGDPVTITYHDRPIG